MHLCTGWQEYIIDIPDVLETFGLDDFDFPPLFASSSVARFHHGARVQRLWSGSISSSGRPKARSLKTCVGVMTWISRRRGKASRQGSFSLALELDELETLPSPGRPVLSLDMSG